MKAKYIMNTVSITWNKVQYSELTEVVDTFFYTFSKGKTLLYIGIAYKQHIKDEIDNTLKDFKVKGESVIIRIGYITYSSYQKITESIVKDAECLLIRKNQPLWNTQCKENYTGRLDFKVISHNHPLLLKVVTA